MTMQIGEYEMDHVILDLGFDANVLPKQTWQKMGEQKLEWSTIQLRMAKKQKIIPLGRLPQVEIDIVRVKVCAEFEVIKIVDDADPYPTLLGLDWAIDMGGIINLKHRSMIFQNNGTRVIVPLDPAEGEQYIEPLHKGDEVNHIYKLTVQEEDWINPTFDGMQNQEKDRSCFSDSDGEMENWKNRLHDVSMMRCLKITKNFWCISSEVRELASFDGSGSVKEFLETLEKFIPEELRFWVLDLAMHATLVQ